MKKTVLLITLCLLSLYSCAQSVNLLATKVSAAPGSLLYVGSNGFLIPLTPPKSGNSILAFSNGIYSFIPMPVNSLPAANQGEVLAYINGNWKGTPASFNIDVSDSTASLPVTLATIAAVKGGPYWLGGYLNITATDNTGTITLQYSYTDMNGNSISKVFTPMATVGNSQYNPVVINCKAGTLITISTVFSNPNITATYNAGDVLHELR